MTDEQFEDSLLELLELLEVSGEHSRTATAT